MSLSVYCSNGILRRLIPLTSVFLTLAAFLGSHAQGSPLHLDANAPLTVNQGARGFITPDLLYATDTESGPSGIYFTIPPVGDGGPPLFGTLYDNGVALTNGGSFTMEDVNNYLVTYQNAGTNCAMGDSFQLGITDDQGAVWSDQGYTVFTFNITVNPIPAAPVALNGSLTTSLGAPVTGTLTASNPDCVNQTLTFSIVSPPSKGSISNFDASSGAFVYTPNLGQSGADSFTFQVSNGALPSSQAGVISIQIQNTPPTATPASFTLGQNSTLNAAVSGTDPDLPPQPLTYRITVGATKGNAVITDASTGAFTYTPQAGRFGVDQFTFVVNDGITDSAPANVSLRVLPAGLARNWLAIADSQRGWLVILNPSNSDIAPVSTGGFLSAPTGVAFESAGTILVADQNNGLLRINPATGGQTQLIGHSTLPFPVGVAVESSGNILVADPSAGIKRFNATGALLTNFPAGLLQAPAGLAIAPGGQIFVADAAVFFGNAAGNKIVQIDPVTLNQTLISSVGLLTAPVALAWEASGDLIAPQGAGDSVVRVSVPGGTQTSLSVGGNISSSFGVAIDSSSNIFVSSQNNSEIVEVNPVSGVETVIPTGGVFMRPFGIAVGEVGEAPVITAIAQISAGKVQMRIAAKIGSSNTVLESSGLPPGSDGWTPIGTATEGSPGVFRFIDDAATTPTRFYKVSSGN